MMNKPARTKVLLLLICMAAVTGYRTLHAQSVEPPPIKMGLWETETSSVMAGAPNAPAGRSRSNVVQGCMTPDSWKDSITKLEAERNTDCQSSSVKQTGRTITMDETCSSDRFTSKTHFEATADDTEHMHGSGTMEMSAPQLPQPMKATMKMTSHFVSSDCGDVKPGHSKVIRHE
jgi:hypothetical protein